MKASDKQPIEPNKRGSTPWERLGLDVVEYARLIKSVEDDIQKKAEKIRWERECKKYENEPPFVFAGLGCVYWLLIVAMCFFVGALLAQ